MKKLYEEENIAAIAEAIREKTGSRERYTPAEMAGGMDAVFAAGEKSQYDAFWDAFQQNGNRRDYTNAFRSYCWNAACYKPKYPIVGGTLSSAFQAATVHDTVVKIVHLGDKASSSVFYQGSHIVTVRELEVSEKTTFSRWFEGCTELVNIRFSGTIGQTLDLHWSTKLSKESIESIVETLSPTASGMTLTLSQAAKEAAFTADAWSALIAPKQNWTISLV